MCSSREGSFLPSVYARGYAMIICSHYCYTALQHSCSNPVKLMCDHCTAMYTQDVDRPARSIDDLHFLTLVPYVPGTICAWVQSPQYGLLIMYRIHFMRSAFLAESGAAITELTSFDHTQTHLVPDLWRHVHL